MSIWRGLEQQMDAIVDGEFAEPVEIHPWKGGQIGTGHGQPDPNRRVLYANAVYVVPGARATGEGGTRASGQAMGRQAEADEWVAITEDQLGNPAYWKMYDRVFLPERGTWHTISVITPSATGRYNVNLIRLQEPV